MFSAKLIRRLVRSSVQIHQNIIVPNKQSNVIYLTFDDGPDGNSLNVLKLLKKHKVEATFFFRGDKLIKKLDIGKILVNEGQLIGNHSYSHREFPVISGEERIAEIVQCQKIIDTIQTNEIKIFRPPQGLLYFSDILYLAKNNYYLALWTIDSKDSLEWNIDKVRSRLKGSVKKSNIILFHDRINTCITVLEELIPYWLSLGFSFSKLSSSAVSARAEASIGNTI